LEGSVELRNGRFVEPSWRALVDAAAALRMVPDSATIAGVFIENLCEAARRKGTPLPSAQARYTGFRFYPLREHVQLLLEASAVLFPGLPLRTALRRLGRAAPESMLQSTIGKVVLGSAKDVPEIIAALVSTYPVHIKPSRATIVEQGKNRMIVRLEQVHFFLDSHHVGVFEGALHHAGVRGSVRISVDSTTAADFLCTWDP